MSASGLPSNSSDMATLPMSWIDLVDRKASRKLVVVRFRVANSNNFMIRTIQDRTEAATRPIITVLATGFASLNMVQGVSFSLPMVLSSVGGAVVLLSGAAAGAEASGAAGAAGAAAASAAGAAAGAWAKTGVPPS